MSSPALKAWNRLRSLTKECLTFSEIKDAAGAGGLQLERVAHLRQARLPTPSASKSELLDALTVLMSEIAEDQQQEVLRGFVHECLKQRPDWEVRILGELRRSGFDYSTDGELCVASEGNPVPPLAHLDHPPQSTKSQPNERPIVAPPPLSRSASVFVSYSHADEKFKKQLETHLKALRYAGVLTFWSDTQIRPGETWFAEIKAAMDKATLAVLLVTKDFLASDFIHENELKPILARHAAGELKLLWVLVRACNWNESEIEPLQAAYPPTKPLAEMKAERDRAWVEICKRIKAAAEE
jgi:hypothetical protein